MSKRRKLGDELRWHQAAVPSTSVIKCVGSLSCESNKHEGQSIISDEALNSRGTYMAGKDIANIREI